MTDLVEVFDVLRKFGVKLNLEKCVFGIAVGKFLTFMMLKWAIEVNPEKIKVIMKIKPLSSVNLV